MQKLINNFLIIFFIIVSCGGGGGGAPTDSDDINDNVDPYAFPNAVNYNLANQVKLLLGISKLSLEVILIKKIM